MKKRADTTTLQVPLSSSEHHESAPPVELHLLMWLSNTQLEEPVTFAPESHTGREPLFAPSVTWKDVLSIAWGKLSAMTACCVWFA